MWKPTAHSEEELERFRARRKEARVRHVACHAPYLVNLASRDREIRSKSVAALGATMETARAIEADAVVFHVGSHLGYGFAEAVEIVATELRELLELTTDRLWLCLENTAGAGGTIGRSADELGVLVDALDGHRRLGLCLDSCHWWASGIDVTSATALEDALGDLDARIGLGRLQVLHVNDAKTPLGSNRDRHDVVAEGVLGDGLATFLGHPAFRGLPAILETWPPGGLRTDDVDLLRDLYRRGRRRKRPATARRA
jgi:deoxyribonuclease-4